MNDLFIEKLFNLERAISCCYNNLYIYELDYEEESKKDTICQLKELLIFEEKMLNSLTTEELMLLLAIVEKKEIERKEDDNEYTSSIKSRLETKIIWKINFLKDKEKENSDECSNDDINAIINTELFNYVSMEKNDIFLSFIDEYIGGRKFFERRDYIIYAKYHYIFNLSSEQESRIIARNFTTEQSLYLDAQFYANANGYSNERYNICKGIFTLKTFTDWNLQMLEALKEFGSSACIDRYSNYSSLFHIRTLMIMYNKEAFEDACKLISDNILLHNLYNHIFKTDAIELFKQDRKRHKTLSLGIKLK